MASVLAEAYPSIPVERRVVRAFQARNGVAELLDFECPNGAEVEFDTEDDMVELAFTPRSFEVTGHHVQPLIDERPIGQVLFLPGGRRFHARVGPGAWQTIAIRFQIHADDRDGWTEAELYAGLDVQSIAVQEGLLRLAGEMREPGFCSPQLLEGLCLQIGVALGRYMRQMRTSGIARSRTFDAATLQAINDRLESDGPMPSATELAARCGLSVRHFFRIFRATTGKALSAYVAERRVARAQALLSSRSMPVKQVAWACGFETRAAFSTAFRRATGLQPTEYRRLIAD